MATVLLAALLGGCSFLSKEADATEVSSEAETESPGATQEWAVDEESQGAIREAVAENDQAQEQPKRDKTQETERTEPLTVEPVRETLNMTHFDNCTFADV